MSDNTLKQLGNSLLATFLLIVAGSVFGEGTNSADAVSGYVTITSLSGEIRRSESGDILVEGDTVATGKDASVSIILADNSVVDLDELSSYTIGGGDDDNGAIFAPRSIRSSSPTLSTATSAGGVITDGGPTTPGPGGSPTN